MCGERHVGTIMEGSVEEGEIWGRGGGNIFSLVTTHDTSAPHTVA